MPTSGNGELSKTWAMVVSPAAHVRRVAPASESGWTMVVSRAARRASRVSSRAASEAVASSVDAVQPPERSDSPVHLRGGGGEGDSVSADDSSTSSGHGNDATEGYVLGDTKFNTYTEYVEAKRQRNLDSMATSGMLAAKAAVDNIVKAFKPPGRSGKAKGTQVPVRKSTRTIIPPKLLIKEAKRREHPSVKRKRLEEERARQAEAVLDKDCASIAATEKNSTSQKRTRLSGGVSDQDSAESPSPTGDSIVATDQDSAVQSPAPSGNPAVVTFSASPRTANDNRTPSGSPLFVSPGVAANSCKPSGVSTMANANSSCTNTLMPSPFSTNESCGCGCGMNSDQFLATTGKKKRGKTAWRSDLLSSSEVTKDWCTLCLFGLYIYCDLCGSLIKMRRPYDDSAWISCGGHCRSPTHLEKMTAREAREERERKAAAKGLGSVHTPKKKQSSLMSFYSAITRPNNAAHTPSLLPDTRTENAPSSGPPLDADSETTELESEDTNSTPDTSRARTVTPTKQPNTTKCCEGIVPTQAKLANLLLVLHKYGKLSPTAKYELKKFGSTDQVNLYAKTCNGDGIPRTRKTCRGIRCDDCLQLWSKNSSKLKDTIKKRSQTFTEAERVLNARDLSEPDGVIMSNIIKIDETWLKEEGKQLIRMVRHRNEFYVRARVRVYLVLIMHVLMNSQQRTICPYISQRLPGFEQERSTGGVSAKFVANGDEFLENFMTAYRDKPEFRDSLLVALMHVFMSKLNGQTNGAMPVKAMNFFIATESLSRSTFDLVSANLMGPCLRSVQRSNAKFRSEAITKCDMGSVKHRVESHLSMIRSDINKLTSETDPVIAVALGFDGTKVPECLQVDHSHKAIVGGTHPNHFIDISDKTQDEVRAILHPDSDVERAKEVKVSILTIQRPGVRHGPYIAIAARPQSLNAKSAFNQEVTNVVLDVCSQSKFRVRLVSVAADGVSVKERWIMKRLMQFFRGKTSFVAMVDVNHNMKNGRYQWIGYSTVACVGNHMIDADLLRLAGVPEELWRVKDFASDLLVIRLASSATVDKIAALAEKEDIGSVVVLCVTLYFIRLKLYSVNAKKCNWRDRVVFSWSSMIWFSSFTTSSRMGTNQKNYRTNLRNIVTETLGFIFCAARSDVSAPRYLTTEANEHTFGNWRMRKREATVLEVNQLEEAHRNRTRAIYDSGLHVSRRGKGYRSTFASFVDAGRTSTNEDSGPVDVIYGDNVDSVAKQLWVEVAPIINSLTPRMATLLTRFGVRAKDRSPFLIHYASLRDLLETYQTFTPVAVGEEDDESTGGNIDNSDEESDSDSEESGWSDNNAKELSMGRLRDAIDTAQTNCDASANIESDSEEVAAEPNERDEVELEDGNQDGKDPSNIFFKLLNSTTMSEYIRASQEGMSCMQLEKRDKGSITHLLKHNTLRGRWMLTSQKKPASLNAEEGVEIQRGVHVTLKVTQTAGTSTKTKLENFVVTSVATKTYGKWYLCEEGKQTWKKGMDEGVFRFEARMVKYDHGHGKYEYVNRTDSDWDIQSIFVLADGSNIHAVKGVMTVAPE